MLMLREAVKRIESAEAFYLFGSLNAEDADNNSYGVIISVIGYTALEVIKLIAVHLLWVTFGGYHLVAVSIKPLYSFNALSRSIQAAAAADNIVNRGYDTSLNERGNMPVELFIAESIKAVEAFDVCVVVVEFRITAQGLGVAPYEHTVILPILGECKRRGGCVG